MVVSVGTAAASGLVSKSAGLDNLVDAQLSGSPAGDLFQRVHHTPEQWREHLRQKRLKRQRAKQRALQQQRAKKARQRSNVQQSDRARRLAAKQQRAKRAKQAALRRLEAKRARELAYQKRREARLKRLADRRAAAARARATNSRTGTSTARVAYNQTSKKAVTKRKKLKRVVKKKTKKRVVARKKKVVKKPNPLFERTEVEFDTAEVPGTLIVETSTRHLYLVQEDNKAIRYGVAVGKEGFAWSGQSTVERKVKWPKWYPPKEMIQRKPSLKKWAGGQPGGPTNPLGAAALYLYQGDKDTLYRIHGTNAPQSIGTAASSGCIRMRNEDIQHLYKLVGLGTKVIVR